VSGSLARYEPFGGYRTKPSSTVNPDISDRGFTGHRQNNTGSYDLGLIYMNARYYLPEIGRFISADTIVPEASDVQSFNRYSYVNNNPVNHADPSGHCQGEYDPQTGQATSDQECWDYLYNEFCLGGGVASICSNWRQRILGLRVGTCSGGVGRCLLSFGGNFWTKDELTDLSLALGQAISALNGAGHQGLLTAVWFLRNHGAGDSMAFPATLITLREVTEQTIWHELGHIVSFRNSRIPQYALFSYAGRSIPYYATGDFCYRSYCYWDYSEDTRFPRSGALMEIFYTGEHPEFWADAFAAWVHKGTYGTDPTVDAWGSTVIERQPSWSAIYRGVDYILTVSVNQ
jgi:RHS repeat-associated protein